MYERIFKNLFTTFGGLATAAVTAGVGAAAQSFAQTGNTTDWKQYAGVAVAAAVPAVVGALMKDTPKVDTSTQPAVDLIKQIQEQAVNQAMDNVTKQLQDQIKKA